jgi:hypothetical protein
MNKVFGACPCFAEIETPEELAATLTDFERGFLRRGVKTLRAAFRKVKHQ